MPIKMFGKTFHTFESAVRATMRNKSLSRERAQAYVATVDRKQNKKEHKKRIRAKRRG